MNKLKEYFGGVLSIIFYILFFYGEIFGIIHSVKKHSTGDIIASIAIPPWAWWRSIEMVWHNDYANVDWDKRLTNDMQTCIYFINQANDTKVNKFEIIEDIEIFHNKIVKYPQDKLEFLKNGTRYFIEYSNSNSNDFINALNEYSKTGDFDWKASDKTKQLEKTLSNYKLIEDIKLAKKTLEITNNELKTNFSDDLEFIDHEKIEEIKTRASITLEVQQKEYKRFFENLFDEEL